MIPNTLPYLIFIRVSIWSLRLVAPASILYCLLRALRCIPPLPPQYEAPIYAEAAFYFLVSLPRQMVLNRSQPKATTRSREDRKALFEKCWESVPDLDSFLRVWFKNAELADICREDLMRFLAWGFLYKTNVSLTDEEELSEYVQSTESALMRTFRSGSSSNEPLRVSTDVLHLQHKPLLFYIIAVGGDDLMTYLTGRWIGLKHYRLPMSQFLSVFPFRPHTLVTGNVSPSSELSYWYRPHTSKTRSPILLIHGIGAGMRTYTGFLEDFMRQDAHNGEEGQTGIIALELMQISMRITKVMPQRDEMLVEILKILEHHEWDKFVIMGHSYGTIIATHLLQLLRDTGRVGPLLLADPVTISIHWGGVPFNFLYRKPSKASEWQLHYFASTDMCVAHTITRRFDWSENVMWKDDMEGRAVTVALADGDIIMDPAAIARYLEGDSKLRARLLSPKDLCRTDEEGRVKGITSQAPGVDILWYNGLNHAEIFDRPTDWQPLIEVLSQYSKMVW